MQRTEYQIDEQVDGGGFTWSSGGGYARASTASQPDAGVLVGEGYALGGGFWRGGTLAGMFQPRR